ncbi:MAG: hypothetical protein WAP58_08375 [Peptococcia bacterium]
MLANKKTRAIVIIATLLLILTAVFITFYVFRDKIKPLSPTVQKQSTAMLLSASAPPSLEGFCSLPRRR